MWISGEICIPYECHLHQPWRIDKNRAYPTIIASDRSSALQQIKEFQLNDLISYNQSTDKIGGPKFVGGVVRHTIDGDRGF